MDYQIIAYVTAVLALIAGILSLEYFRDYRASIKWYKAYPIKHRELRVKSLLSDFWFCFTWFAVWLILTPIVWWFA